MYNLAKSAPGIEAPAIYTAGGNGAVLDYSYRDVAGKLQSHSIFIGRRPLDGRFIASGMFPAEFDPLTPLAPEMEKRCNAVPGYTDQWFDTSKGSRVDMSEIAN